MRVTTQMVNESARRAGLPGNNATLLDYINQNSNDNSLLSVLSNKNSQSALTKINSSNYEKTQKAADALGESIAKLTDEKNDLFAQAEEKKDSSKVKEEIQTLIENYNALLNTLSKPASTLDAFYNNSLKDVTKGMSEELSKAGITINQDGTLNVDQEKFKAADLETLQKLFGSSSELTAKLDFVSGKIGDNAKANLESIISTYGSTGSILSGYNDSKYNFLG